MPRGLKRILFNLTHPISLMWDIGLTECTEEEIETYYLRKYNPKYLSKQSSHPYH